MSLTHVGSTLTQRVIQPFTTLLHKHPRLFAFTTLATISAPWFYGNYRAYLDIGPGGLPYNVFGWLLALGLRPFARETKTTEEYDRDGRKERYLEEGDLKERRGERPKFGWHVAPVRQQDKLPSPEIAKVSISTSLSASPSLRYHCLLLIAVAC